MSGEHEHCWHPTSQLPSGLGTSGQDDDICCQCGAVRTRSWTLTPDPAHGPYVRTRVRQYGDATIQEPNDESAPRAR